MVFKRFGEDYNIVNKSSYELLIGTQHLIHKALDIGW